MNNISSNGTTVWVHDAGGVCIGRFSRFGAEVHGTVQEQVAGKTYRDCVHGLPPRESWERFVRSMKLHHAVVIGEHYRPNFVSPCTPFDNRKER